MSYVTLSDLGVHGGHGGHGGGRPGGGGRWRGGWWGGGGFYPPLWYWDVAPIVVSPVQPDFTDEDEAASASQAEEDQSASVDDMGMGRIYADAGPGAYDALEVDREARDDEVIDEAVPAQKAFLARKALGLGEVVGPPVSDVDAKTRGHGLVTAGAVLAGAVAGALVGSMIYKRLSGRPAAA